MSELFTIKAACGRLGVGRTKLYGLLASRRLKAVKIGKRTFLREEDVSSFIRDLPPYLSLTGGKK